MPATPTLHLLARRAPFLTLLVATSAHAEQYVSGDALVALFGLAFKQGTDDLRESPFVLLAERLLGRGFDLRIYDRSVRVAQLMGANRAYIDREIPHLERLMVADPAAALDGARVAVIGHVAPEDRPALLAGLAGKVVIDLAGMAALRDVPGVRYEGLCW